MSHNCLVLYELLMPCELSIKSEMIKFSRYNLKYQNVRSPPEHTANGNAHTDIFATGYYCIRICNSKQFSVGLKMLSDGLVYFLKIKIFFFAESTKTILWL